jgi:MFS family permease
MEPVARQDRYDAIGRAVQPPRGVLAAAFLFNLGQGVLRPSLPLYLQQFFGANYRMVTLIPVVFGAGKWVASLPTGYLLDHLGRGRLMVTGLLMIAVCDIASVVAPVYLAFPQRPRCRRHWLGDVRHGRYHDDGGPLGCSGPSHQPPIDQ